MQKFGVHAIAAERMVQTMHINHHALLQQLSHWTHKTREHRLPPWESIPALELYMDQVIVLLNGYLEPANAADDKGITQSMINNYVKLKIIPAPVKKRYSRIHLAYLMIVCVLKPTLSISTISRIIPLGLSEQEVHDIYCSFTENHSKALEHVTAYMQNLAAQNMPEQAGDLVMQAAVSANLFKTLAETVVREPEGPEAAEEQAQT